MTNTLRREEQESTDPYPWLAEDEERKNTSKREILEKYVNLEMSYLTQREKDELMKMQYKYKCKG